MSAPTLRDRTPWKILGLAVTLAYGGMLLEHGQRLWTHDYFQFYPVFLIAVGWMTAKAIRESGLLDEDQWQIEPISFGLCIIVFGTAIWFWSPWLGAVSFLLLGESILRPVPDARSFWRLLILLIPLPMGLDGQLVQKLQRISSLHASQLLELIGVPHLMRGNVLEMPGHRFFVEEACSGISSIYLMTAATALYIVLVRMRFIRAIPLLASVLWWAMIANTLRIVIVAAGAFFYSLDLSHGWKHEALGITMMLIAFTGIWSTRCLIDFFLAPVSEESIPATVKRLEEGAGTNLTPRLLWDLLTLHDQSLFGSHNQFGYTIRVPRNGMVTGAILLLTAFAATYWGVANKSLFAQFASSVPAEQGPINDDQAPSHLETLDRDCFGTIDSLVLKEFSQEGLDEQSSQVPLQSRRWLMEAPGGQTTIAITGPFSGWNDIVKSHKDRGWMLERTSVHSIPGRPPEMNLLTLEMTDANGDRAHIHCCQLRPTGELLSVPEGYSRGMTAGFKERLEAAVTGNHGSEVWQLELIAGQNGSSAGSEVKAERFLLRRVLSEIQTRWKNVSRAPSKDAGPQPQQDRPQQ